MSIKTINPDLASYARNPASVEAKLLGYAKRLSQFNGVVGKGDPVPYLKRKALIIVVPDGISSRGLAAVNAAIARLQAAYPNVRATVWRY